MGAVFRIKGSFERKEEVPTYMYESSFPIIRSPFPLGLVPDVSVIFFRALTRELSELVGVPIWLPGN